MIAPPWFLWARTQIGVRETPGPRTSAAILDYVRRAGRFLGIVVNDDETPWCGTFAAAAMRSVGIDPPLLAVRARSWAAWGMPIVPRLGAVLVFERPGGGHVGFYAGETLTHYRVLGGNQRNSVSEVMIERRRCVAVRWPAGVPANYSPLILTGATAPLSTNEA